MKRGGPLKRHTPMPRKGLPTRGRRAVQRVERDAAWDQIRLAVYSRDHGRCVLCGEYVPADRFECHHRKLRKRGGRDEHANLITLCSRCHHGRVHAFPKWATDTGYMVPSWRDPADWPVSRGGGWLVPANDTGQWRIARPDPDQQHVLGPWEVAS